MQIRVLRGAEVRDLLPMSECVDLMRPTMIALSEGRVVLPLRSVMRMPGERGMLGNMPGYLGAAEVDTPLVLKSRFFVDCRNSTIHEGGEYLRALESGAITPRHILGEIGDVANGSKPGRTSPLEVTVYKSLGVAPQDLASSHYVLQKARAAGIGQVIDF